MKNKSGRRDIVKGIGCLLIALGLGVSAVGMHSARSETFLRSRVVKLMGNGYICSGEQVHTAFGTDYILSAGHCDELAIDGSIEVHSEDGRVMERRVIAEDAKSDLLLIEGIPNMEGIPIAKHQSIGDHVRTFTHGNGFRTYKSEGELIDNNKVEAILFPIMPGDPETDKLTAKCKAMPKNSLVSIDTFFGKVSVCVLSVDEVVTTAFMVPGSSGGMVVNDSGELTGVVSAGGDGFGYLVRLSDIQDFLANY
jgi:S1-C subfamily serine protease